MDYLVPALLLFMLGNIIFLERITWSNKKDIEYIKKRLCGDKEGGEKK